MSSKNVFAGRVIFDHLAKTAGQAINEWLIRALGTGCVTPNLIGNHQDLIRKYGGLYSVISAHVHFPDGEGLDPRYQYMTLLREPVDRIISWLYFLINNHDESQLPELVPAAKRFLESDGTDVSDSLVGSISNAYVEHFCRMEGVEVDDEFGKVQRALTAIQQYEVVGIYEDMPMFLQDVARLIGLGNPSALSRINVTQRRPAVEQVTPALHNRIVELNQLDLQFFAAVKKWKTDRAQKQPLPNALLSAGSIWQKFDPVRDRIVTTTALEVRSASLREGANVRHGQLMTFDVDFSIPRQIDDLEMGIHIFDSDRQWAFGTNSTLLGQPYRRLSSGLYRVSHHVIADLPAGSYTAGFAFAKRSGDKVEELAWRDSMCEFQIEYQVSQKYAGYSYLPAQISLQPIVARADESTRPKMGQRFYGSDERLQTQVGRRDGDDMVCTGKAGCLIFGPYVSLASGCHEVAIRGTAGDTGVADVRIDVAIDRGSRVIWESTLTEINEDGTLLIAPISLDTPCADLEIRVWVTAASKLKISQIEITPLE